MDSGSAVSKLRTLFDDAGLDCNALDPWQAWKVFKVFLKTPLDDGYDAAGVQLSVGPDTQSLYLVRQLSRWSDSPAQDDEDEDEVLWLLSVEFYYKNPKLARSAELDIWSIDFRTLEEFASVVEGESAFQDAMAAKPYATDCCVPEV